MNADAQQGLQIGHENRRRDALAADIGQSEGQSAVFQIENIVVVAADAAGGQTNRRELQAAVLR